MIFFSLSRRSEKFGQCKTYVISITPSIKCLFYFLIFTIFFHRMMYSLLKDMHIIGI